jgi:hypothetical protein
VKTIGIHASNIAESGGRAVVTPLDALSALKQMGADSLPNLNESVGGCLFFRLFQARRK